MGLFPHFGEGIKVVISLFYNLPFLYGGGSFTPTVGKPAVFAVFRAYRASSKTKVSFSGSNGARASS